MKRLSLTAAVITSLSVPAFAQAPAPAPAPAPKAAPAPAPGPKAAPAPAAAAPAPAPAAAGMDMSKMGPSARKPSNEAATKKEIEAWWKQDEILAAAKNWDAMAARVDFPVFMLTDSVAGVPSGEFNTREQYVAMMKPMWESMPAGTKSVHKLTITVLSDALANVVDDFSVTTGKQTMKGRNASLLAKVAGQWKFKGMVEAGWGGMNAPATAAPAPAPMAPAPAAGGKLPPPPPPAAAAPAPAPAAKAPGAPPPPPPAPKK